jgi:hypothetical protein
VSDLGPHWVPCARAVSQLGPITPDGKRDFRKWYRWREKHPLGEAIPADGSLGRALCVPLKDIGSTERLVRLLLRTPKPPKGRKLAAPSRAASRLEGLGGMGRRLLHHVRAVTFKVVQWREDVQYGKRPAGQLARNSRTSARARWRE